jgi:hypothetical protein
VNITDKQPRSSDIVVYLNLGVRRNNIYGELLFESALILVPNLCSTLSSFKLKHRVLDVTTFMGNCCLKAL